MQALFNLPKTLKEDLARFKEETERFKKGDISAAQYRSFRVPQGVYEQRQDGTFMLRVRFPAGGVLPHQMRALASVARKYGNGILHVTTRQDIQVHSVALDDIHPALMELYGAGLSTRGAGGNTVRNITSCFDAGVCHLEAFDVTPYSIGLTEFLLPDPLNYQLPRKYKIAFSGCPKDCAGATVNDLGFIAEKRDGESGFAVYVGGGMGAHSRVADLFEEFVPAEDIHLIAEAVKRVFDKHGNRKDKHQARLRFLMEKLGLERFRELYQSELSQLRREGPAPLQVRNLPERSSSPSEAVAQPSQDFEVWREKNAVAQKQKGYYLVQIPLLLGDVSTDVLEKLADVIESLGERMVRTTQWQNLVVRWVHQNELAELHRKLAYLNLAETPAPIIRNTIACAGASTCRLGVCLSRGLARALIDELTRDSLDLNKLGELNIHISGCPNSCGRHPVGQIGFFGAARRIGERLMPYYMVQIGGRVGQNKTRLAEGKETIPARNIPAFAAEFLHAFGRSPQFPDFDAFLEAGGWKEARRLVEKHKYVPSFEEDKNYYFDWGAEELFSLAGRGPGECGAGVFDLIEVDLASAREALEEGRLFAATVLASRALLVTQGQEAKDNAEALELFTRYFLDRGLVKEPLREIIEKAQRSVSATNPEESFSAQAERVAPFVDAVQNLYDNMDPSLRFRPVGEAGALQPEPVAVANVSQAEEKGEEAEVDQEADFQGVACPLNYVKTKLLLAQMAKGQVLSVLLDQEGARNVPQSAEQDGHQVLSVKQDGKRWRVVLRKG